MLRKWAASCVGLKVPTTADIMRPQIKERYVVGDKIGPWPIVHLNETELVAGRDNKHLDFRLSVLKEVDGERCSAVDRSDRRHQSLWLQRQASSRATITSIEGLLVEVAVPASSRRP